MRRFARQKRCPRCKKRPKHKNKAPKRQNELTRLTEGSSSELASRSSGMVEGSSLEAQGSANSSAWSSTWTATCLQSEFMRGVTTGGGDRGLRTKCTAR